MALHRPYIRAGVRAQVEDAAEKSQDGRYLDANTGEPIDGKYDLGHKAGHEYRTELAKAEQDGLTQQQFNDRMNDPELYQIEDPVNNRSHAFEDKSADGEGSPKATSLHRPYIRAGVRAQVEGEAKTAEDGRYLDANTGEPIDGQYDLGHKTGHEYRTELAKAEAEGLTQQQFNDRMNDPSLYQVESPHSNRSHVHEAKSTEGMPNTAAKQEGAKASEDNQKSGGTEKGTSSGMPNTAVKQEGAKASEGTEKGASGQMPNMAAGHTSDQNASETVPSTGGEKYRSGGMNM